MKTKKMQLKEWELAVLPALRECALKSAPVQSVTLLAYFFGDDARLEREFYAIECSFLSAFRNFGRCPAVLVTNRATAQMKGFCERHRIDLQTEPTLIGGDVTKMSRDCIGRLHRRFTTEYVAVIQTDGLIVNPGLERFVGEYDYIGAPWVASTEGWGWSHRRRFPVGNGGFCLRSRRICEDAARVYNAYWKHLPYSWFMCDDVFYAKTMPALSRRWRETYRYPDIVTAAQFSIENHWPVGYPEATRPVGLHAQAGFDHYTERFGLPMAELLD